MLDREATDRIVDVASVALISVAAVLSAVCGYQSARWGEQQARLYSLASANRIQSAQVADRAGILTSIDVTLFLHYLDAVAAGNTREAQFLRRRFRPEMRPAMDAWLATKPLKNPKAPSSPFAMPQYTLRANAEARKFNAQASAEFDRAQTAARHADEFLLLTVIFASVSFLAGVSTKMVFPRHAIVITVGVLALIYGLVRLGRLPFL
jgi:hypothetical protein